MAHSSIETWVTGAFATAFSAESGLTVACRFGHLEESAHLPLPAIVWVPTPGSVSQRREGPDAFDSWAQRTFAFSVYLYGADGAQVDAMHQALIRLIERSDMRSAVTWGAWEWLGRSTRHTVLRAGDVVRQSMTISTRVSNAITTTELESFQHEVVPTTDITDPTADGESCGDLEE